MIPESMQGHTASQENGGFVPEERKEPTTFCFFTPGVGKSLQGEKSATPLHPMMHPQNKFRAIETATPGTAILDFVLPVQTGLMALVKAETQTRATRHTHSLSVLFAISE